MSASPRHAPKAADAFDAWRHGLFRVRELDLHFDAVCALWWDGDVLLTLEAQVASLIYVVNYMSLKKYFEIPH